MPTETPNRDVTTDLWNFTWPIMEVFIAGKSSIDLQSLSVRNNTDARDFLRSYGYDPENPRDFRFMHGVFIEALSFIEKHLMPVEWLQGLRPPEEIVNCEDPRQILLWASSAAPAEKLLQVWSCAILRVMHTIAHLEGVHRLVDIESAREQIMGRIQSFLRRDDEGRLWFGEGNSCIQVQKVEWKEQKTRESIILKLLHKRANVAETIYDFLGVRIVTRRLADVMLVVKFLRQFHMVTYANCIPSRSRNSLIDLDGFRVEIESLRDQLLTGTLDNEGFEAKVSALNTRAVVEGPGSNPHSSSGYRSIQLTCRQLIRFRNPAWNWIDKLLSADVAESDKDALRRVHHIIQAWPGVRREMEYQSFFPFELQVLDNEAYSKIEGGDASHHRYKWSQIKAARRRVLHRILQRGQAT
jgi:uncharacterized protein (TIGR04562 family)